MAKRERVGIISLISLALGMGHPFPAQASILDTLSSHQNAYEQDSKSIYTLMGAAVKGTALSPVGNAVAIGHQLLATSCHIILADNRLGVRIDNQIKPAKLIYHYNDADICILNVDDANFTPVKIRPSGTVQMGEAVAVVSNPQDNSRYIVRGKITNKFSQEHMPSDSIDPVLLHIAMQDHLSMLQSDASVSAAASGSGLFDQSGNLIGIAMETDPSASSGLAIPTEFILKLFPPHNTEGVTEVNPTPLPAKEKTATASNPPAQTPANATMAVTPAGNTTDSTAPKAAAAATTTTAATPPVTASAKVTQIGQYGEDNVGAYKSGQDCFISMSGIGADNTLQSLVIWFPADPNYIYVFPHSIRIEDAYQQFKIYDDQDLSLDEYSSSLILNNYTYPLMGSADVIGNAYPILIRKLNFNPVEAFLNTNSFVVQTKDDNATTIHYGLHGFDEALNAEQTYCEKRGDNSQDQ